MIFHLIKLDRLLKDKEALKINSLLEIFVIIIRIIDYCFTIHPMNDCDSFLTSVSDYDTNPQSSQVKFISSKKWQKFMIDSLRQMLNKYINKKNIITDLITIVSSVPQASFVQATLRIQPFKPQFLEVTPVFTHSSQSTMAQTVTKHVRFEISSKKASQEIVKRHKITEKTLTQQFEKDFHPFKFITKNFKRLLELKFKSLIDSKKINSFDQLVVQLKSDMHIFTQFLHKGAQPYKKLFKLTSFGKQVAADEQNNKFEEFLDSFISDNQKMNKCLHKIIVYASRKFYFGKIQAKIKDYSLVEDFSIPQQFRIDGCYIRSINALMQFAQGHNHQKSMRKLLQIRQNILVDINEFYAEKEKQGKDLQVSAQVQIEIVRFCVAKLKGWGCEILGQLKYLEFVYGEEEIGYKYEQSSYMYTQLSMAFQILDLDGSLQNDRN